MSNFADLLFRRSGIPGFTRTLKKCIESYSFNFTLSKWLYPKEQRANHKKVGKKSWEKIVYRYTNADLKISVYVCVHIKTIPW